MATAPLVPDQIQTVFQTVTATAIGALTPSGQPDPTQVRIEWQPESQPMGGMSDNFVSLRCVEEDEQWNRIRDSSTGPADPELNCTQTFTYIRVWRTYWNFYGTNSFDNARQLRSMLLTDQGTKDSLAGAQLWLVTDIRAPIRFRDRWPGGQWIERTDFEARFNELVTEAPTVPVATSVQVVIEACRS